jgi:uroporphyrinogen-III synthase
MRVLVLRPGEGARRTAARLKALRHEAICAPVLETVGTGQSPPSGPFDGVIATSAQAFAFVKPSALLHFLHLPLMCVGARTAAAAREAGFSDIRIEAADARRLALAIAKEPPMNRPLYLAGQDRKAALEDALHEQGVAVIPWVTYKARAAGSLTAEAVHALRAGQIDAAFHFSRRSAAIFCDLVRKAGAIEEARAILHVAISEDAANGLRDLAPPRLRIANAPDETHMLGSLS